MLTNLKGNRKKLKFTILLNGLHKLDVWMLWSKHNVYENQVSVHVSKQLNIKKSQLLNRKETIYISYNIIENFILEKGYT